MKIEELRIIVDEREKKSGIPKLLSSIGVKTEIKTLPIGDYIVAPETIVERKSIQDLISSVFDGRLFDQCDRLKNNFEFPIILVEGNINAIEENRKISITMREEIREYGVSNFSWENIVNQYEKDIIKIMKL